MYCTCNIHYRKAGCISADVFLKTVVINWPHLLYTMFSIQVQVHVNSTKKEPTHTGTLFFCHDLLVAYLLYFWVLQHLQVPIS